MAFPTGWTRRAPIVIDHTKVTANQTDFPVPLVAVNFPNEMVTTGGSNAAQTNGGDIRFSTDTAGASRLPCEILVFTQDANPALAVVEIYVPVTVSSSVDVTIYVWYKAGGSEVQPAAGGSFGSQLVWDSVNSAVYQLTDVTGGSNSVVDSKAGVTGTPTGSPTNTTGPITGGATAGNFVGASTQEVGFTGAGTSYLDFNSAADFTWEAWIKPPNSNQGSPVFAKQYLSAPFQGWHMGCGSRNSSGTAVSSKTLYSFVYAGALNSSNAAFYHTTSNYIDGNWHHMVVTRASSVYAIYVDGTSVGLTADIAPIIPITPSNAGTFHIGGNGATYYTGVMGRIRISITGARSSTWISTNYNAMSSPSTFSAPGTPVPVGGVVTQPIMRFIN